jgi:hypothetical protein
MPNNHTIKTTIKHKPHLAIHSYEKQIIFHKNDCNHNPYEVAHEVLDHHFHHE